MNVLLRCVRLALTLGIALVAACSFGVDFEGLGNGECPDNKKACNGKCIPIDNPQTGCAQISCFPCNLDHAQAICDPDGKCAKSVCIPPWLDCDNNPLDCETDSAHDVKHCGRCSRACDPVLNGEPACSAGSCTIGPCKSGYADCDDNSPGCETQTSVNINHCGQCNKPCASGVCEAGRCQ